MERLSAVIAGLGGVDNVVEIEPCMTRLRIEVLSPELVDGVSLRALGVHGVMVSGRMVQIVIGPDADLVARQLSELMWAERSAHDARGE